MALLAKERAASCQTDLPPSNSSSFGHVGWNANISAFGLASFSDVVDGWFEEGRDFLYLSGKCKESATCQHYTQVFTSRAKTAPVCPYFCRCIIGAHVSVLMLMCVCCCAVGVGHIESCGLCQAALSERGRPLGDVCLCILPRVTVAHIFPLQNLIFM